MQALARPFEDDYGWEDNWIVTVSRILLFIMYVATFTLGYVPVSAQAPSFKPSVVSNNGTCKMQNRRIKEYLGSRAMCSSRPSPLEDLKGICSSPGTHTAL